VTLNQLVKKLQRLWGLTPKDATRDFSKKALLEMIDCLTRDVTKIPKLPRNRRCDPECPGYIFDEESGDVEACDECGILTDCEACHLVAIKTGGFTGHYVN
jgi:hypothetical protein